MLPRKWTVDAGTNPEEAEGLSAIAASVVLGVSQRTVRRAITRGDLSAIKRGGVYRIAPADLARYTALRRPAPSATLIRVDDPHLIPFPRQDEADRPTLPRPLSSLIGRERDLAAVISLVRSDGVRLTTLTGPGGVGKTRLALRAAVELSEAFPDGVWFVPLALVRDPALVAVTILRALGVVEPPNQPTIERLKTAIHAQQVLLLLDNLEHLPAAAALVSDLLGSCANLVVLATSRTRLNVSGEHQYPVPPLAVPSRLADGDEPVRSIDAVGAAAAVRLFIARARAVDSAFRLTTENADAVAAICARVDGLPLAIELAAAQTRLFAPAALLARMGRRLPLLTGGPRDQPARLRTMTGAIAWSYDLLTEGQRALFRRLSVFVGGCTIEAAEVVASADRVDSSILDGIAALVDASLLRRETEPDGEHRLFMLETVREYGLDRLAEAGEASQARDIHAHYFATLDGRLDPNRVEPGDRVDDRLWRVETDHPNLRAALVHLAETGDAASVLRLAGAMSIFWAIRGHLGEGRRWLEWALDRAADAPPAAMARALAGLSFVLWSQGHHEPAAPPAHNARVIAEGIGDAELTALAIHLIGLCELVQGHMVQVESLMEDALGRWRVLDSASNAAMALVVLSVAADRRGDAKRAALRAEEALTLFRPLGHPSGAANALAHLGRLRMDHGDNLGAALAYQESLQLWAGMDARWSSIEPLGVVGDPNLFPRWTGIEDRRSVVRALVGVAAIAAASAQPEQVAVLIGAVDVRIGPGNVPIPAADRANHETAAASARVALDQERFDGFRSAGRALRLRDAVAVATAIGVPPASKTPARPPAADALTARERDVLRLLAEGRTDPEIAEALFVAIRTVRAHVGSILAKLGVPTRTAAATYAVRRGLV